MGIQLLFGDDYRGGRGSDRMNRREFRDVAGEPKAVEKVPNVSDEADYPLSFVSVSPL